jgi:hypothetical protein
MIDAALLINNSTTLIIDGPLLIPLNLIVTQALNFASASRSSVTAVTTPGGGSYLDRASENVPPVASLGVVAPGLIGTVSLEKNVLHPRVAPARTRVSE